jgi:hypothetical protein
MDHRRDKEEVVSVFCALFVHNRSAAVSAVPDESGYPIAFRVDWWSLQKGLCERRT